MVKRILQGDDPRVIEALMDILIEKMITVITYETVIVPRESVKTVITIEILETYEE